MGQNVGIQDDGSLTSASSAGAKLSIAITALCGGVANCAALTALNLSTPSTISDGATVWVETVRDYFVLRTQAASAVQANVVASSVAGRNWFRLGIPDPTWASLFGGPTVWEIDTVGGNDENLGTTQVAALKTWAELERRLGLLQGAYIHAVTTVNVAGDMPVSDPMRGRVQIGPVGGFNVKGRLPAVPLYSGVVTAKTDINFATGSGESNTVTASWSPASYISAAADGDAYLVRNTTRSLYAWITKDVSGLARPAFVGGNYPAGTARLSPWCVAGSDTGGNATAMVPSTATQVGDTIEVFRLYRVRALRWMNEGGQRGFFANVFTFLNFDTGNATIARSISTGSATYFNQCRTRVLTGGGQHVQTNCFIAEPIGPGEAPGFIVLNSGCVVNSVAVNAAQFAHATWDLQGHVLFQGCVMTAGRAAYLRIRNCFFEDCVLPCLQGENGATINVNASTVCGNGNTDAILQLKSGAKCQLTSSDMVTQFKAATSGAPVKFNSATVAPPLNTGTGAFDFAAKRDLTLANIDAAYGSGGFGEGGMVFDPISGCFCGKSY